VSKGTVDAGCSGDHGSSRKQGTRALGTGASLVWSGLRWYVGIVEVKGRFAGTQVLQSAQHRCYRLRPRASPST
jgi:hypothetical protein